MPWDLEDRARNSVSKDGMIIVGEIQRMYEMTVCHCWVSRSSEGQRWLHRGIVYILFHLYLVF